MYKYIHHNHNKGEIDLTWKFKGRHLKKKEASWKNNHLLGGGLIKHSLGKRAGNAQRIEHAFLLILLSLPEETS